MAPYTTDGDLALDPLLLGDEPQLATAMRDAGFRPDLPELRRDPVAGPVTEGAIRSLPRLFGRRSGAGVAMAIRALRGAVPEAQVATLSVGYVERLLAEADALA
ncbi:MAG: hypothetical protein JSS99_03655 [Actinobacteria bacterium]|nr:hypothetical protein [Actinomycetota bacterium]